MIAAVLFAIGGVWVSFMHGFTISGTVDGGVASSPMNGPAVEMRVGAWLDNYRSYPILWAVPAIGLISMVLAALSLRMNRSVLGWWLNAVAWAGTIGSVGVSMFPFMMPSTINPSQSLTVWNATASELTLGWMLVAALVFVPTIICYTSWAFAVMGGKRQISDMETLTEEDEAY